MDKLRVFHVMPLLAGHEAELAADAERLLHGGVCTDIACMMTLVPEGDPPEDKARILGDRFVAFREVFRGDSSRVGILAQATIGHGWTPDEPAPFEKIICPDGTPAYQMCPLGQPFQRYVRDAFLLLGALRPAFVMVDDDFRLLSGRRGCYCPLHLEAMGRRVGRSFTRESLLEALRGDPAFAREYDAELLASLLLLAGVIRDALDETDPAIPGSFCTCYGDVRHAGAIARRLAGDGNPRLVRINNARYLSAEMRSFPLRMYHGAAQVAALDPDVTVLAETDAYPHNRYSTGANLVHAHYAGSILDGCHGAKHWVTRLHTYQPVSGLAYRDILTRHGGFYETLFRAVQESVPCGYVASALPSACMFNAMPDRDFVGSRRIWGAALGPLGLPCNYARMPDLPVLLTGEDLELFPDDDLRRLLKNGALLDGIAAEGLCLRGFGADIGVSAGPWDGPRVSAEGWEGVILPPAAGYTKLTPAGEAAQVHSSLLHRRSGVSEEYGQVGVAATLFENPSGARMAVMAATFAAQYGFGTFDVFDEDRKRELVELIEWVCGQPIAFYYPGDAEVYVKLREFPDGRYLMACFNLGHDPLDAIPVTSACVVNEVEMIAPRGSWERVRFENGRLCTPLHPAEPKVFRIACAQPEVGR